MWFEHPQYLVARRQFVSEFTPSRLSNLHYSFPKIIFLCGGDEKHFKNRKLLENYFQIHIENIVTFRAEDAWSVISQDQTRNALELENWLADFSDIVIILVESFGTVAELGAFSLNQALRKKLLPIVDKNYEGDISFINTGPVRWVNEESKYGPSIFTNFNHILTCIPEIKERIDRRSYELIPFNRRYGKYNFTNKVMLFFLALIINSLGPITIDEIISLSRNIIDYSKKKYIQSYLSIAIALGMVRLDKVNSIEFYTVVQKNIIFDSSSIEIFFNQFQKSRAKSLWSLQKIDIYRKTLCRIVDNAT